MLANAVTTELPDKLEIRWEFATKDIIDYRAKGLHLTREPYPHLFVIIDEYAEMISDTGAITACSPPASRHAVRMDNESLPTGMVIPNDAQSSTPTARTVA